MCSAKLILALAVWSLGMSTALSAHDVSRLIDLGNGVHWFYTPNGESSRIPVDIGVGGLGEIIPLNVPCCKGEYYTEIKLVDLSPGLHSVSGFGLLVPPVGGLRSVQINETLTELPKQDYTSRGTIIPFVTTADVNVPLRISIFVDGLRTSYAGMWSRPPAIGRVSDLAELYSRYVIHQVFVPLVLAILLVFICVIFVWLKHTTETKDPVYHEFVYALLSWALFYLFLSGEIRRWSPFLGVVLHFPARSLAAVAIYRLIGTFSGLSQSTLNRFTKFVILPVLIQLLAGIYGLILIENLIYIAMNCPVFYVIFRLYRREKNTMQGIVFVFSTLAAIGYLSDSIKLAAPIVGYHYSVMFLNRYTNPPLLLMSLVYLVYRLTDEMAASLKKRAFEDAAAQLLHDIQSPLAALEVASKILVDSPEQGRELIERGANRIRGASNSLRNFGQGQHLESELIGPLVGSIIREKRLQYRGASVEIRECTGGGVDSIRIRMDASIFSRVLSNLINNAVESIDGSGVVSIDLTAKANHIMVRIMDTGSGIPIEVLNNIGNRGFTFGKAGGSGLGVHHARKSIHSWGGTFEMTSEMGTGTTVTLSLPVVGGLDER